MTLAFTPDGVEIDTLAEIVEELEARYKAIYGPDINTDQDSPDGQRIGIEAKARADVQAFALALYNSFDPDFATGQRFRSIIKLAGITLRPATRSSWDIEVTTDRPVTLTEGYTIEDDVNQQWFVPADVSIPPGTTTVTFLASNFGAVTGLTGAALTQATVVLGVTSLTATVDATVGAEEETVVEARQRRRRSVRNPAYSTTGSLFARLANTAGVTDVQVYENDTKTDDPVTGIDANTIWCIVEGGTQSDIAETMAKNKTGGTGMRGAVEQLYTETRTRPDGSTFTVPHLMRFDRPTLTPIYVNVTATRKNASDPVDTVLIAQRLAATRFLIGENAVASELYDVAYGDDDPNFVLTDLEISDDDVTFTDGRLASALDGKYTIAASDVTVTEVTP